MRVLFCLSCLYNGMGLSSLLNGAMVSSCCNFFFLWESLGILVPNQLCCRTSVSHYGTEWKRWKSLSTVLAPLELASWRILWRPILLHGHWHSQGGCGEKLLGGSSKHLWRQLVQERENMAVLCGGYCWHIGSWACVKHSFGSDSVWGIF